MCDPLETAQVRVGLHWGADPGRGRLLEGRPATTHWAYWRLLEKLGARYVPEQRWVEDGMFITSAGVSAGIDMALHLTERLTDQGTARMVQLGIEYDPNHPTAASSGTPWTGTSTPRSSPSSCRPPWLTSRSSCTARPTDTSCRQSPRLVVRRFT